MAKFLKTEDISAQLRKIIEDASERLVIISPYLKINERIKELLEDKNLMKDIDVRVIYGKSELRPEESNWLEKMSSIRTSFRSNLHAKCYLNENKALLTSMNLYEFSQQHNDEMGILITRDEDPDLYEDIWEESRRLLRNSEEIRVTVAKVEPETAEKAATTKARRESQQAKAKTDCPEHNTPWREGNQGGLYHAGGCTPSKLLRGIAEKRKLSHQQLNDRLKREFGVTASNLTPEQVTQVYTTLTR